MQRWRGPAFEVVAPEGWRIEEWPQSLQIIHEAPPHGQVTIGAGAGEGSPGGATQGPRLSFDAAETAEAAEEDELVGLQWIGHHGGVAVIVVYLSHLEEEHEGELADVRAIVESVRILGAPEPRVPDELVRRVIDALEVETDLTVVHRGDGRVSVGPVELDLENLHRASRLSGDEDATIAQYLAGLGDTLRAAAGELKLDLDAHGRALRPMIKREEDAIAMDLVWRPLVGPLVVVYAVDQPHTLVYVGAGMARDVGAKVDTLHELALPNLLEIPFAAFVEEGMGGLAVNDSFNASRLLLPELLPVMREELGLGAKDEVLVGVPSRDMLAFARVEAYETFAATVRLVHEEAPHPLVPDVFVRSERGLEPYDPSRGKSFWKKLFG